MSEQRFDEPEDVAALAAACDLVGDRWSLPIVAALLDGPLRYGELQQRLPAIAPNILTTRLRRLEQEGLVLSSRYSSRPPRFDYRLTSIGAALGDPIRLLAAWAGTRAQTADAAVHEICGTPLEVRWWCPTCADSPQAGEEASILA
jgi:DNA-binding HxlR family transcriptional regulator